MTFMSHALTFFRHDTFLKKKEKKYSDIIGFGKESKYIYVTNLDVFFSICEFKISLLGLSELPL